MRIALLISLFGLFLAQSTSAQDLEQKADAANQSPNGVIAGPFGYPSLVLDESLNWSDPIQVYADSSTRIYVPDITSPGWIQWHVEEFRKDGIYMTPFYIYEAKTRGTAKEILTVDTHKNTAALSYGLVVLIARFNLTGTPTTPITKAISHITAIIKDDSARFHGMTASEFLNEQRASVSKMIEQANHSDTSMEGSPSAGQKPLAPVAGIRMLPPQAPASQVVPDIHRMCGQILDADNSAIGYYNGRIVRLDYADTYFWLEVGSLERGRILAAIAKMPSSIQGSQQQVYDSFLRVNQGHFTYIKKLRNEVASQLLPMEMASQRDRAEKWLDDQSPSAP